MTMPEVELISDKHTKKYPKPFGDLKEPFGTVYRIAIDHFGHPLQPLMKSLARHGWVGVPISKIVVDTNQPPGKIEKDIDYLEGFFERDPNKRTVSFKFPEQIEELKIA